jgi:hypothetical protein
LRGRLDAFGNHRLGQHAGGGDDARGNRHVALVAEDVPHEALVELDVLDVQLLDVAQRRTAGAEIIQADANPASTAFLDDDFRAGMIHRRAVSVTSMPKPTSITPG